MGAKREYVAIFSIGAKLLGSFRGAMTAAQSRLRGLQRTAAGVTGVVKKLTLAFGGLFTVFGGFLAANVFKQIFSGASDEARAAEERTRSLLTSLMQMNEIRKKGAGEAQRQLALIYKHNEGLEKQGVLHHAVLDAMAVQIARGHIPVKNIQDTIDKLQDVLVATKGVAAGTEEATALGFAVTKAVSGGKLLGLQKQGVVFTKEQTKAFGKLTSETARYSKLIEYLRKNYGNVNAEARNTPLGRIQLFQNAIKTMADDIGKQLLPAQAELADSWRAALPELGPLLITSMKALLWVVLKLGNAVRTRLLPWWKEFQKTERFNQIKAVIGWMIDHWKQIAIAIGVAVAGMVALNAIVGVIGVIAAIASPVGLVVIAIVALGAAIFLLWKYWDKLKSVPILGTLLEGFEHSARIAIAVLNALGATLVAVFTGDWKSVGEAWKLVWQEMVGWFKWAWGIIKTEAGFLRDILVSVAKAIGQAFKDYFLKVLDDIKGIWTWMSSFSWEGIKKGFSEGIKAGAAIGAQQGTGGYQHGGIVARHTIAHIAERGPEAVVPLRRTPRALALLSRAAQHVLPTSQRGALQTGMTGMALAESRATPMAGTSTSVNFAPVITIHGNASAAEQAALDTKLRDLARDFVAQFQRAQSHERRLSYEGGYG